VRVRPSAGLREYSRPPPGRIWPLPGPHQAASLACDGPAGVTGDQAVWRRRGGPGHSVVATRQ
ncbi:MAG TPA: hypothetical protein VGJ54_09740, partial [Streptosporangiaceae bacterium]